MRTTTGHDLTIQDRKQKGADYEYRAQCAVCRWSGPWRPTRDAAITDGMLHG